MKNCSKECSGDRLDRFAADAPWQSKACRASQTPIISARLRVESGKRSMAAQTGLRSSTNNRFRQSVPIAVAPSDHNVIYAGTGEAAIRGNTTYGTGVFKSIDGGKTWENVGLKDSRQIGAVIVDPRNENVVLVAALGHAFGPNQERGIFRTADGGKTWTKVLSKDENTGGIDVVFDPHNPNIVFASLWQARRQPWFFSSGGPGSGLYRSEDNGVTWKRLGG